jgi:predicted nucleotidyltransferase
MPLDPILDEIVRDLRGPRGCHTAILYGSRARGDHGPASDYDIVGIKESGEASREAREWRGVFLDLFIYPQPRLAEPDPFLIRMIDGVVLFERDGVGTSFLAHLRAWYDRGPVPLPADEAAARRAWPLKMLERIDASGIEADYRRVWLQTALLEDYFVLRGKWFLGPKRAFAWLREHDAVSYEWFRRALQQGAALATLHELARRVVATV